MRARIAQHLLEQRVLAGEQRRALGAGQFLRRRRAGPWPDRDKQQRQQHRAPAQQQDRPDHLPEHTDTSPPGERLAQTASRLANPGLFRNVRCATSK